MTGRTRKRTLTVHPKLGQPIDITMPDGMNIQNMSSQLEAAEAVKTMLCHKHGWLRDEVRVSFHGKWED